jgi:thiamine biosynthesis lipoprotein
MIMTHGEQSVTAVARLAMATRFEILLHGKSPAALQAAGEQALDEVERLEAQLSLYRPSSEIARVNALAARQPVRVSPPVFQLLRLAQQLHRETGGAFDITIAPLVRCWGFMGGSGHLPDGAVVEQARALIGMHHIILDSDHLSVRFDAEGVMVDLGAIGKGYAIDCAVETLREAGMTSALIHGGSSTVYALGRPPEAEAWKVAIAAPPTAAVEKLPPTATILLRDEALSVSAVWGRSFEADGKTYGHVLDPRTGQPVSNPVLTAVVLPSATETDALSTALLVAGLEGGEMIGQLRPGMRSLMVRREGAGEAYVSCGNLY